MNFGYARISAKDQRLDTQLDQLNIAGVDRIFHKKVSGTTIQRLMVTELMTTLRTGDTLIVARMNRLGRNSAYIRQLIADYLYAHQVRFVALDLGIDTATPAGRLLLGIFAALAKYDRESIRKRATSKLAKVQACLAADQCTKLWPPRA